MPPRWRFPTFLIVAFVVALAFEVLANTIGDGHLFEARAWPVFFLCWYGTLYSLTYVALRNRPLWLPVLAWAVLGPVLEIVMFRRFNPLVDPVIYAMMVLIPTLVDRRLFGIVRPREGQSRSKVGQSTR
jgi:hypothetical protein